MKKIIVIVCLVLVASTYGVAKRIMKEASVSYYQQEEKSKIKKEELPEAARKSLDGDAYKGWTVANIYKLKDGQYEVELKKDNTAKVVKFDKDGKAK